MEMVKVTLVVVMVTTIFAVANAQAPGACLTELMPCNEGDLTACCAAITKVYANDLPCLCQASSMLGLSAENITKIFTVCGIKADASACSSPTKPPAPATPPTPSTPTAPVGSTPPPGQSPSSDGDMTPPPAKTPHPKTPPPADMSPPAPPAGAGDSPPTPPTPSLARPPTGGGPNPPEKGGASKTTMVGFSGLMIFLGYLRLA